MSHRKPSLDQPGRESPVDVGEEFQRTRTLGAVSISAELFEKLYLSPPNTVKGDLRRTFGNPTPVALVGFLIALTPLSCDLMGWRGATGSGSAGIPVLFFFGGLLQLLGGILEWVIGNTFPFVVFCSFGAFFLSFAGTLSPSFAAFSSYAAQGEPATAGLATQGFNASFGFFTVWMAVLCFVFLLCAFRTNVCFVVIFLTLTLAFIWLTVAYWLLAADFNGSAALAGKFVVAAGATCLVTCAMGWWIFLSIMLATLEFPFQLPVGDLSHLIKSKHLRAQSSRDVEGA